MKPSSQCFENKSWGPHKNGLLLFVCVYRVHVRVYVKMSKKKNSCIIFFNAESQTWKRGL